ncbi:hypothetical protein [Pseudomonas koreensis]
MALSGAGTAAGRRRRFR